MIKILIIACLVLAPAATFFAGASITGVVGETVAGFHDEGEGMPFLYKELAAKREVYEKSVEAVNAGLCEETAAYGVTWGVLAAIDLMANDNLVRASDLAEELRANVTYRSSTVVTRTYRREVIDSPHANGAEATPAYSELLFSGTNTQTERLVDFVDTYRGVFRFEYEKDEKEIVIEYDDNGIVIEKAMVQKYFLRGIVYEPDYTRLRNALISRKGGLDANIPDGDVIFAAELGRMLTRGNVQFYALDAAVTLAEYKGGSGGGTFALSRSNAGYVWPVVGHYAISSPFGVFRNIRSIGLRGTHRGIDIPAPVGTPVVAVTEGVISNIFTTLGGGRSMLLEASGGRSFLYVHLNCWADSYVGRRVLAGDIIARSGNTGRWTTGPHLHFEVHLHGTPVDPVIYAGW